MKLQNKKENACELRQLYGGGTLPTLSASSNVRKLLNFRSGANKDEANKTWI